MKHIFENTNEKRIVGHYYSSQIKDNNIIGIGTGSTVKYFINSLAKRIKNENMNIKIIPTSYQTYYKCRKSGISCIFEFEKEIDLSVDGADQISYDFFAIKGYGGALL